MASDINANLEEPEGTPQAESIADKLATAGLMYMGLHFLPRRKPWLKDMCTWNMQQDGREFWYQTDYILGTYCRMFQAVAARDMQHHSDNYMFLGCLRGELAK